METPKALNGHEMHSEITAALGELEVGMHIVNTARIRLKKAIGRYPQGQNFETYDEQCARLAEGNKQNPWLDVPDGEIDRLLEKANIQSG